MELNEQLRNIDKNVKRDVEEFERRLQWQMQPERSVTPWDEAGKGKSICRVECKFKESWVNLKKAEFRKKNETNTHTSTHTHTLTNTHTKYLHAYNFPLIHTQAHIHKHTHICTYKKFTQRHTHKKHAHTHTDSYGEYRYTWLGHDTYIRM